MKVFVSNHFEILADALQEALYQGEGHPFAKKWVVVPSERIKQALFLRWAGQKEVGVAAGFKMVTRAEILGRLFPDLPSSMELSLKIEKALEEITEKTLLSYLQAGGVFRKTALCDRMSHLFLQYLFCSAEELQRWLDGAGWQQMLWRKVFKEELPWKKQKTLEGSVYLFQPSLMPWYQFELFKKMETTCFLFSPCSMYWGDLKTPRQQRFLLQHAAPEEHALLADYFTQDHPLLANWGKQGRALLACVEQEESIDLHAPPMGNTLLTTVQNEMLSLTLSEKTADDSIQIHTAPSKLREVEVVWELVQRVGVAPREIIVLSPNIQEYASAIELVFQSRGGSFDYAIHGLETRAKSSLIQGFEDLLKLPRFRFSKEAVERLLFCPPFLARFKFRREEVQQLQQWMCHATIRYDLNAHHTACWKSGLVRLVEGLVTTEREEGLLLDFSAADLLNRWIEVIQLFEKNLKVIADGTQLTLKEWARVLKTLIETFFAHPEEDEELLREIARIYSWSVSGVFPFSSLERVLHAIFHQTSAAVQGSHLQAVKFASLEKGSLLPAKVVILMGMEEGSFPRQDPPSSLQQFKIPSRAEEDRYLFLEAVCSAREKFIVTYCRFHPEDGKSQKGCMLLEELRAHCPDISLTEHPLSSFDPAYFQEGHFQSFSTLHFQVLEQKSLGSSWNSVNQKVPLLPPKDYLKVDTRMLRKLARHPLQFFFEERLSIDFTWKEPETEFILSSLEMARLRRASLRVPLEKLILQLEKEGKLPMSSFRDVALEKIKEEIGEYHHTLHKLQVRREEIYAIELSPLCQAPTQIDEVTWVFPSLSVQISDKREVTLQGRIEDLTPHGMLYHGDDGLADLVKVWPLFLIAQNLCLPQPMPLLLTKKGKVRSIDVQEPLKALNRYMLYFEKALSTPSPLLPRWSRSLFKEEKIPESEEDDEIVKWAKERHLLPPLASWVKEWMPHLQEVIREIV